MAVLMRWLRWLILLLVAIAVALLAVANRTPVTISLDPLPYAIDLPLYAVMVAMGLAGFVVGAIGAWWSGRHHRRLARQARKAARNQAVAPVPAPDRLAPPA